MNILFLEDQGGVFDYLIEELEDEQHVVFAAQNIPKANYYWREEEINCIVVDSNMPPDGLTDEQRKHTHGGLLSGWVWIKYYVFEKKPSMKRLTILVTAYLDELRDILGKDGLEGELEDIRGVVAKGRLGERGTKTVLEYVREIEREMADGSGKKKKS